MIPANWRRLGTERLRRFLTGGLVVTMGFTGPISSASAQDARQTNVAVAYVTAGYLGYDYSVHGWNVQFSAQRTRRWTLVGEFVYERENPNYPRLGRTERRSIRLASGYPSVAILADSCRRTARDRGWTPEGNDQLPCRSARCGHDLDGHAAFRGADPGRPAIRNIR